MKNLVKLEIDLGNNEIGDTGYEELIDNLMNLKKLEKLNLVLDNNTLGKEGYDKNWKNLR